MIATGQPAVITCPIIGGFASNNPNHPRTLGDIVRHGIDAVHAGAAALHIHARDAEGTSRRTPRCTRRSARRSAPRCPT